jgi:hypothetical protein
MGSLFVARYDAEMTAELCKEVGIVGAAEMTAAAVSSDGHVAIAGTFGEGGGGEILFGNNNVLTSNEAVLFVALYDSQLATLWARKSSAIAPSTRINAITFDSEGNLLLVGELFGSTTLGSVTLASNTETDAMVAVFGANGNVKAARVFGDENRARGTGVASLPGMGVVAGEFDGTIDFGLGPRMSEGGYDVFLAWFAGQ